MIISFLYTPLVFLLIKFVLMCFVRFEFHLGCGWRRIFVCQNVDQTVCVCILLCVVVYLRFDLC